jgi:LacI family transcriptional regulator
MNRQRGTDHFFHELGWHRRDPIVSSNGMPVRMKDIARDLGVSVMTVSKALRDHSDIGEETRKRVLKRAQDLNYLPNAHARSLVTGRSGLIGLIVPDLIHPFFAEVARGLATALGKKGYYLIITSSEEDSALESHEIDQLLGRRIDVLVIASSNSNFSALRRIEEHGTPHILIDREAPNNSSNFVGSDDIKIGILATEHLIKIGCKRIAHIRGPENSPGLRRLEGYFKALARNGMKPAPGYVVEGLTVDVRSQESGAKAARALLRLNRRPDGIFCFNDPLAIGAIETLSKHRIDVPNEISVIGCGNLHYDSLLRIPLSSIDQKSYLIGERAAEMALGLLLSKRPRRAERIVLEPDLIIRNSSERNPRENN